MQSDDIEYSNIVATASRDQITSIHTEKKKSAKRTSKYLLPFPQINSHFIINPKILKSLKRVPY